MKEPNPLVKSALELGPLLLFFGVFMWNRGGTVSLWGQDYTALVFATLIFIPVLAIATLIQWRLSGRLAPMQVVTLVLVVIFGGLSVWLNDPRFFKMKPTIIYLLFAAILLVGLARERLFLKTIFAEAFDLEDEGWSKLTLRFGLFFVFLAGVNEIVWRTQSEDVWTSFKVFGIAPLTIVFMLLQGRLVESYTRPKP